MLRLDLARGVVSKRHKLMYHVLWQLPYVPVDFSGDALRQEWTSMHRDGQLSPELSRLYFAPTRLLFELFDLEADPAELTNLAGRVKNFTNSLLTSIGRHSYTLQ